MADKQKSLEEQYEFETIETGNVWKPQTTDESIFGRLINITYGTKFDPKGAVYHIERLDTTNEDEKQAIVFGTKVIDERMFAISIGDMTRIIYRGLKQSKSGQDYKDFEVQKVKTKKK